MICSDLVSSSLHFGRNSVFVSVKPTAIFKTEALSICSSKLEVLI